MMTLNRKDARAITINNEKFRWAISPGSGYVTLIVEHEATNGQRLEVCIESDINDYWADFPLIETMNLRVVKPREVRQIILEAINEGWMYREPGKPITYKLKHLF